MNEQVKLQYAGSNSLLVVNPQGKLRKLFVPFAVKCVTGINFIRPMLEIPKADIYKFANTHYIPYLPTSTPAWSQRGKIRDCIKPALQDWSPKLIPAMFQVSAKISSMSKIVDMYVKQTYEDIKTKGYLDIDILDLNFLN